MRSTSLSTLSGRVSSSDCIVGRIDRPRVPRTPRGRGCLLVGRTAATRATGLTPEGYRPVQGRSLERASGTESPHRAHTGSRRSIHAVGRNSMIRPEGGSFLLELLYYAGWQLRVQSGETVRIHAARHGIEIDVTGRSLPQAAGTVFARAMRSGHHAGRVEGG